MASALSSLFDELQLNEDCYAIGHTSKLLAAELVNISSAKTKKVIFLVHTDKYKSNYRLTYEVISIFIPGGRIVNNHYYYHR